MEEVISRLYVGGDNDYLKHKDDKEWSVLRCCKEGPGGHRETLGYTTAGSPKGTEYLSVKGRKRLALNFIDPNDPNFIPVKMVETGIEYVGHRMSAGDKVLVACNAGHSRGPTVAMLYMRGIGELPHNFITSERIFRTLYPEYDPGIGMRSFARTHWHLFENLLKGK